MIGMCTVDHIVRWVALGRLVDRGDGFSETLSRG
jgi:hypothetical protein